MEIVWISGGRTTDGVGRSGGEVGHRAMGWATGSTTTISRTRSRTTRARRTVPLRTIEIRRRGAWATGAVPRSGRCAAETRLVVWFAAVVAVLGEAGRLQRPPTFPPCRLVPYPPPSPANGLAPDVGSPSPRRAGCARRTEGRHLDASPLDVVDVQRAVGVARGEMQAARRNCGLAMEQNASSSPSPAWEPKPQQNAKALRLSGTAWTRCTKRCGFLAERHGE